MTSLLVVLKGQKVHKDIFNNDNNFEKRIFITLKANNDLIIQYTL